MIGVQPVIVYDMGTENNQPKTNNRNQSRTQERIRWGGE